MPIQSVFRLLCPGGSGGEPQHRPATAAGSWRARGQRDGLRCAHGGGDTSERATRRRSRQTNGGARRWTIRKDSTITLFKIALSRRKARKPGWCTPWPFRRSGRGRRPAQHLGSCTKEDARPPHPRERSCTARCAAPSPKKAAFFVLGKGGGGREVEARASGSPATDVEG